MSHMNVTQPNVLMNVSREREREREREEHNYTSNSMLVSHILCFHDHSVSIRQRNPSIKVVLNWFCLL